MAGGRALAALVMGSALGLVGMAMWAPPPMSEARTPAAEAARPADQLFADGRFAEATAAYERAVAEDAGAGPGLAGLARMRLYQHREGEAAALARRAMAFSPGDPLAAQVLKTVAERRAAFGPGAYRIDPHWAGGAVDFVVTDPLPVVRVRVDGRPARFLIDTGAPDIALDPAFAKALGLTTTQAGVGVFAGGLRAQVERTEVADLEIGGLHVKAVPAAINPAKLPGLETEGVIGAGLLAHVLASLDYCRGRLVLAPRRASAAFERRAAAAGANIVPMWWVGDHFIFARGKINGVEGLFSIDTGLAGAGLVATQATVEAAHIALDEKGASTGQGGGGAVRFVPFRAEAQLGALTRGDVPGVYMPEGDPYGIFPFKVAGALSHGFFHHSRVTFDFEAMRLVTESCE